ncbi:MAG TPA: hypothetical protein VEA69_16725 [Tepidisphaeraceae bacterium]|nr:hypothetical protein [Tepidisphaeraceae bacterium]
MGKALALFADFVLLTNQYNLEANTESGILNEVQNQTTLTGDLMKGGNSKVVKTGKSIRSFSQFSAGTGAAFYQPGDSFTAQIEDGVTAIEYQFRFLHDSFSYTKHEIEFNMGGADAAGINSQTEDLLKAKRQFQRVGMHNLVDAAWWTTPSAATMETSATANRPYSIRCFITEDGLFPSGFTTLGGVASSQTRFRNKVANYTAGAIDTTLKDAFHSMIRKVDFKAPPSMTKYFESTQFSKFMILTDVNGVKKYAQLTEEANDRLVGDGKDLGVYAGQLGYQNIPIKYVTEIDNLGYASTAPRYFWINSQYLFPVFHGSGFFAEEEPMNDRSQPYVWTVHLDFWYQLICTSRQRLGIICPG